MARQPDRAGHIRAMSPRNEDTEMTRIAYLAATVDFLATSAAQAAIDPAALGAGVEHAFSNNWTLKLEYLYVDLDRGGDQRYVSLDAAPYGNIVGVRRSEDDGFHVVRAGVNFKFGGPAYGAGGPVVAAY